MHALDLDVEPSVTQIPLSLLAPGLDKSTVSKLSKPQISALVPFNPVYFSLVFEIPRKASFIRLCSGNTLYSIEASTSKL
jgi:hypothetical protein